ncbi:hypothetical protein [Polymorphospora sp. NPDC050346]|uniref:hypothetical protein n=1 Tax=Polymorphospora sp. NPDC050346 TaxID=3155780 RepID=UPI00340E6844
MSAQKVATGVGLAALAALFVGVGLPALLPPPAVPEIRIVVPVTESAEMGAADEAEPDPIGQVPPATGGDDDDDDGGGSRPGGGSGDDGGDDDDSDDDDDGDDD